MLILKIEGPRAANLYDQTLSIKFEGQKYLFGGLPIIKSANIPVNILYLWKNMHFIMGSTGFVPPSNVMDKLIK